MLAPVTDNSVYSFHFKLLDLLCPSVVLNWEQFSLPGHTWQCLETFLAVTAGEEAVPGI